MILINLLSGIYLLIYSYLNDLMNCYESMENVLLGILGITLFEKILIYSDMRYTVNQYLKVILLK